MARRTRRPAATHQRVLTPCHDRCAACGGPLWVAYHSTRTVTMLAGI